MNTLREKVGGFLRRKAAKQGLRVFAPWSRDLPVEVWWVWDFAEQRWAEGCISPGYPLSVHSYGCQVDAEKAALMLARQYFGRFEAVNVSRHGQFAGQLPTFGTAS